MVTMHIPANVFQFTRWHGQNSEVDTSEQNVRDGDAQLHCTTGFHRNNVWSRTTYTTTTSTELFTAYTSRVFWLPGAAEPPRAEPEAQRSNVVEA